MGSYMPYDKYGTPDTHSYNHNSNTAVMDLLTRDRAATWSPKYDRKWLRLKIHV